MNYTEQLEREAEKTRFHLTSDLEELRERFSPSQVVDQLIDYVQEGSGGQFFHNLRRQVTNNPLPVTLIGAGVAWLMMSSRTAHNGDGRLGGEYSRGRLRRGIAETSAAVSDTAHEARARFDEGRERVADTAQSTLSSVRDTARDTYGEIYDAAADTYEHASERVSRAADTMTDSIRSFRRGTAETGHTIAAFCREQPLVVAGIGLAIGAALGAALPSTEIEDRMMGDASEAARRKMREIASETTDKVRSVGEHAVDAAHDEAHEQDPGQDPGQDLGRSSGDPADDGTDKYYAERDELRARTDEEVGRAGSTTEPDERPNPAGA